MSSDQQPVSTAIPSPRICETRAISGTTQFADCQTKSPGDCRYAVSFGRGQLCFNPNWKDFEVYQKNSRR